MRNFLLKTGLSVLWLAAGGLGRDIAGWIAQAEDHGLAGRPAFDYVWRKARTRYHDIGGWLLNLLIEALLAKHFAGAGLLESRLQWPAAGGPRN